MMRSVALAVVALGEATTAQAAGERTEGRRSPGPEVAAFWTKERRRAASTRHVNVDREKKRSDDQSLRGSSSREQEALGRHRDRDRDGELSERGLAEEITAVADADVESPTPPELRAVGRLFHCFGSNTRCFACSGEFAIGCRL